MHARLASVSRMRTCACACMGASCACAFCFYLARSFVTMAMRPSIQVLCAEQRAGSMAWYVGWHTGKCQLVATTLRWHLQRRCGVSSPFWVANIFGVLAGHRPGLGVRPSQTWPHCGGDVHMTIDEHACTGAAHDYDRHDARQHAVRPHSMVNRHHAWPAEQKYAWRKKVRQAYVWPREG